MNEDELKELWVDDQNTPTIDFVELKKSLGAWHDTLHHKVRIDIWAQSITAGLTLVPVLFFPKLIFASLMVVVLGVWYVQELRKLYEQDSGEASQLSVKQSLKTKILMMKNYFRRTRLVMYVLTPWIIPAVFYGIGTFDKPSITLADWSLSLIKPLIIYEIGVVVANELYFKFTYAPALNELKALLLQLDSENDL